MAALDTAVRMRRLALTMMPLLLVLVCAGAWLAMQRGAEGDGRGPEQGRRSPARMAEKTPERGHGPQEVEQPPEVRALDDLLKMAAPEDTELAARMAREAVKEYPLETMRTVIAAEDGAARTEALRTMMRLLPSQYLENLLAALRDSEVESDRTKLMFFFQREQDLPPPAAVAWLFEEDTDGSFSKALASGLGIAMAAEAEKNPEQAVTVYENGDMDPKLVQEANVSLLTRLAANRPEMMLDQLEQRMSHPPAGVNRYYEEDLPGVLFGMMGGKHGADPALQARVLEFAAHHDEERTVLPFALCWALEKPVEAGSWVISLPDSGMRERAARRIVTVLEGGQKTKEEGAELARRFTEAGVDVREK